MRRSWVRRSWIRILVVPSVLILGACQDEAPELTIQEGAEVARVADPAASELLRSLVGRLTGAMEEGGPIAAIDFCSTEAIPLTLQVQEGLDEGMVLKRTSFRYRNPDNAPDEAEEEALVHFEDAIAAGESSPATYVQKVSEDEYRFYRALYLGEVCLQCHGESDSMDPGVLAALQERYPGDLALGYKAGDFRGVVRVSVPASKIVLPAQG
jgi:hypothetical protein